MLRKSVQPWLSPGDIRMLCGLRSAHVLN